MITALKKKLAIRSYRNTLAACLEQRHGWRANYSPKEIRDCALATGTSLDYLCFAYAMYCTREDFDAHHAATGETCDGRACDYQQMRSEIATSEPAPDHGHSTVGGGGGGWFSSDNSGGDGDSGAGGDGGGD